MNGAEALVATAISGGVEICFANPGTTELPLALALDSVPGLRSILCLHENVATGAADGYGRMAAKPAMCLLHLGQGLANGLTNLHNARRAFTPVLNVIGDHATWHLPADPLLATDVESLAHQRRDGASSRSASASRSS
jgi:acetolactate synthase-1/2/3 large subunit